MKLRLLSMGLISMVNIELMYTLKGIGIKEINIPDQIFEVKGIRKLANDLLQVADILNKENNIG